MLIARSAFVGGIVLISQSTLETARAFTVAFTRGINRRNRVVSHHVSSAQVTFARTGATKCYAERSIPTIEELSNDDFMKQVSHSQRILQMLATDPSDQQDDHVEDLLKAQLSHSDGIRGFFVTYLTADGDGTPADRSEVPTCLVNAMNECSNEYELVSLACMNVIMPTGMVTMHKDPALSLQSQKTAERGVRVLRSLSHKAQVREECQAILAVASGDRKDEVDTSKVAYWEAFFEKWGYEKTQKHDIAKAVRNVLSP